MKGKGKGELTERSLNMVARAGSIKEFQTGASQLNHVRNKAGYTAQDAPSRRTFQFSPSKITGDGRTDRRTDGRTDRRTDGRTDTTSYRDATAHLKREKKIRQ